VVTVSALTSLYGSLLLSLTKAGRDRMRRLRDAETDAIVAARRMQVLQLLVRIGGCHLGIADLARRQLVTEQPGLEPQARRIIEALSIAITHEIGNLAHPTREVHR